MEAKLEERDRERVKPPTSLLGTLSPAFLSGGEPVAIPSTATIVKHVTPTSGGIEEV